MCGLAVILVVVAVFCIVAVADNGLGAPAFERCIFGPVRISVHPRGRLIYYHFITMVNIVTGVTRRQCIGVYPGIIVEIYILVCAQIIVGIDIRHVIVIGMVITYRAPI